MRNDFWLAYDIKYGNYVSIKIKNISLNEITNENLEIDFLKKIYKYNFSQEWINSLKEYYKNDAYILSEINFEEHTNIIQMLNSFMYKEENSENVYLCNVYEITGISLKEIFDKYKNKNKVIPLPYVRIIAKQILIGLDFIHRFGEIIHNNLNMDNILICLTKDQLEIIQETGYLFNDQEKNEDEINFENNLIKGMDYNSRQIKGQEKQMEKMELSQNDKNKNETETNNNSNNNFNINEIDNILNEQYDIKNKYDINGFLSRPRIASVPKYDLKNNKYNFDINNYINEIQAYIKEKNRIKSDLHYRKIIAIKKNFFENENNKTKIEILKKLNKERENNDFILDSDIKIKISGFNQNIKINNKKININSKQEEKYLPPEIILNSDYNETIDIWAVACIIFELATGEPLFNAEKDTNFTEKENHLLKFFEILGNIPDKLIKRMINPKIYFDKLKKLTQQKNINRINILDLLKYKFHFKDEEAVKLNDFLSQMLNYLPENRPSASKMLSHPWLNMSSNFDYIDKEEFENNKLINENDAKKDKINLSLNESNSEEYAADDEDNDNEKNLNVLEDEEDSGDENPDKINIPNYNNSFSQYGQFIDLTSLDKANPQFNEIIKMDESE